MSFYDLSHSFPRALRLLPATLAVFAGGASMTDAVEISDVIVSNVTTDGFTVVWQTSDASRPGIDLFSDAAGTVPLDGLPKVEFTPLSVGNPEAGSTPATRAQRRELADLLADNNLSLVRVSGLDTGSTVYFRPRTFDPGTGMDNLTGPAPVVNAVKLMDSTAFIADAQLLAVDFSGMGARGLVAVIAGPAGTFPLTAVVGDGPNDDVAVFNLADLVDSALGSNASFSGPVDFSIGLLGGLGGGSITHTLTFALNTVPGSLSSVQFSSDEELPAYFVFDPVADQDAGLAFTITIRAMDADDQPLLTYSGTATLSGSTAIAVGSGPTGAFQSGVLTHTVRIDNGGQASLSAVRGWATGSSANFIVRDNFGGWRNANFTPQEREDNAVSGMLADPGSASIPNLLRYGYGLGRNQPDRGRLPVYTLDQVAGEDFLSVTFHRLAYAGDVAYRVESSADMETWHVVDVLSPGIPEQVTVRDNVAMGKFRSMRVVVVHKPSFASYMTRTAPESVISDAALHGAEQDPGSTGVSNLERYAYGLDYSAPDSAGLPAVSARTVGSDTFLSVSFNRLPAGADVQYVVQAGSDANGWQTIQTVLPGSPAAVTVQDTQPFVSGSGRSIKVVVERVL